MKRSEMLELIKDGPPDVPMITTLKGLDEQVRLIRGSYGLIYYWDSKLNKLATGMVVVKAWNTK